MTEQVKRRAEYDDGFTQFTVHDSNGLIQAQVNRGTNGIDQCSKCGAGKCSHTVAVDRAIANESVQDTYLVDSYSDLGGDKEKLAAETAIDLQPGADASDPNIQQSSTPGITAMQQKIRGKRAAVKELTEDKDIDAGELAAQGVDDDTASVDPNSQPDPGGFKVDEVDSVPATSV